MRLLLFVCLTSAVCAETLPQIEGENLMGRKIVLPEAASGHRAILVIGWSRPAAREPGGAHALRPAGLLAHHAWTLSRGFGQPGFPIYPVASYRT